MDQGTEPIRQDIDEIRASMTDKMEKIEAKIKGTVEETTGSVKRMVDVKYHISERPWMALGISVLAGIALGSIGDSDNDRETKGRQDYRGESTEAAYERARTMSTYPSNYGASSYGSSNYGQGSYSSGGYGSSNYGQGNYGQGSYGSANSGQGNYGAYGYNPASGSASYTTPGASSGYDRPSSQEHNQYGSSQPSYGSGYNQGSNSANTFAPSGNAWGSNNSSSYSQPSKPGVMDQLSRQFGGEIEMLKGAAVSSLVGIVRDTIRQNFPSMHQEMERMRGSTGASTVSNGGSSMSSSRTYSAPSTSSAGATGATSNTDYAHSAANNPSHLTGIDDPARGSTSPDTKSSPDDLQRGSSTL